MNEDDPHVLYRFVDGLGQLLYVGITKNPAARIRRHGQDQYWWEQVATIHLQRFGNRRQLRAMESYAIANEHPMYNIQGKYGSGNGRNDWDQMPCPVCGIMSFYRNQADRWFHLDGSSNRYCWAEISSGRHNGLYEVIDRHGHPIPDGIWLIQ